jgi:hypothetical protein
MPSSTGLSTWLTLALVILVWPVFFVALWSGVMLLASLVGGWGRLGGRYRAMRRPNGGHVFRRVTGMFEFLSYKRTLAITVADDGLFVAVPWMFRIGHPTLFIPWNDIRNARRGRTFFWKHVAFDIGDPKVAGMRLPPEVFDGTPVFID